MPTSHDGSSPFEFELRFSENFGGAPGLPATIENAFRVTNGVVDRVARVVPGQNRRWTVAVRPDSSAKVIVELPATGDCEDSGAVCAEDGRPLSSSLSAEVAGEAANAQADGPVLTLTWSSPRDGFAAPGGADFAVRVDGVLRPVTSVALRNRGAVLTLADPVLAGQAVVLDYLGSAMHPLRDAAGVLEPAWRDLPAVNVTGRSGVWGGDPAPGADHAWLPSADGLSASFAGRKLGDAGLAALPVRADVRRLDLSANALTDISALVRFRDLRSLDLSGNAVSDIAPLQGLTKLRRLDLGDNDVVDLWPLAELPHLKVLLLDRNRVANVGAVTHLGYLENLALSGNPVEDLSPLADLGSLRRLDLGDSPARDLSPVGDLGALVWLRLPVGGGDAPVHRLARLRWLLVPGTPGTCLGCPARETAHER